MPTAPFSQATIDAAAGGTATPVAQILSLGAYIPDGVLTNADMEAMVDTSDAWIVERTGIRERRRVPPETVAVMGARAAAEALAQAGNPSRTRSSWPPARRHAAALGGVPDPAAARAQRHARVRHQRRLLRASSTGWPSPTR